MHSGNIIRTGDKSLAALVFTDDKSLVKIRANSEVTVKGSRDQKKVKKSLFMRLGELWAKVTKGNPFQVETPSGVAAVKGTEFYVTMDQSGNMVVFCMEGLIELINRLGRLDLNAGERGELLRNNRPSERRMRDDEKPRWAGEDDLNELQIEFEDENGEKKILKIRFRK
ncbi:MAG: FecR family protein [candidate division KSB1 bacterium]|nr:FecR family protein [candidate division KSB1 bacterium]